MTPGERVAAFRKLHETGSFVMPNPWNEGSARLLAQLGFRALATTSSGFAWSKGRPDGGVPVETVLEHLWMMAHSVDLPINADFESGFATTPEGVALNVTLAARTGIAGLSIEDSTGDPAVPSPGGPLLLRRPRRGCAGQRVQSPAAGNSGARSGSA